jgi:hypothetical protein
MELPASEFLLDTSRHGPGQWAVIALGVLTVVYVAVIRPMRKGRKDPLEKMQKGSGPSSALAQQRALERDMAAVLVEYEQMIRRMTAQLDTRAAKLQLLIEEADGKLLQLKQATAPAPPDGSNGSHSRGSGDASSALGRSPYISTDASTGHAGPVSPMENGHADGDPQDAPGSHAAVYDLADRGRSLRQIAEELDRPDGEVELILALRHTRS